MSQIQLQKENVHLLKAMEGCAIVSENRADNFFEFVYRKEGETKYLSNDAHRQPANTDGVKICWADFDTC